MKKVIKAIKVGAVRTEGAHAGGAMVSLLGFIDGNTRPGNVIKKYDQKFRGLIIGDDVRVESGGGIAKYYGLRRKVDVRYPKLYVAEGGGCCLIIASSKKGLAKAWKSHTGEDVEVVVVDNKPADGSPFLVVRDEVHEWSTTKLAAWQVYALLHGLKQGQR